MHPVGACFAAAPVRDNGENESDGVFGAGTGCFIVGGGIWLSGGVVAPSDGGGVVIEPPVELPVELTGDEVAADEVDVGNTEAFELGAVGGGVLGQEASMDLPRQGDDAVAENGSATDQLGYIRDADARLLQDAGGAAGRVDFPAEFLKAGGKFADTGFVVDRNERSAAFQIIYPPYRYPEWSR